MREYNNQIVRPPQVILRRKPKKQKNGNEGDFTPGFLLVQLSGEEAVRVGADVIIKSSNGKPVTIAIKAPKQTKIERI